jgi:hypothetical protein
MRDDTCVIFGQKFSAEKRSVWWCVVVMQQPVLLSPNFGAKFSHFFAQLAQYAELTVWPARMNSL